ncbi:MAG: 30S ribosomal protein S12 methylthiotransferase RimO [Clostridia bacterium]|nr:30S ribosomal protein S12 methylthiotransferase RimO [Clostridia bacterium]
MSKQKIKVGFVSLGCPKNQLDTEVMLHELYDAGFEIVSEDIDADVIVVNTCAFIESAKQESIDNIIDVGWLKKNRTLKAIVVTGCLAERYRDAIFDELPEVDAVLGVGSIHHIVEAVKSAAAGKRFSSYEDKNDVKLGGERIVTTSDYFAYLKVAEGCDNHCAYCAIPSIRGRYRSRTMEELVEEAKTMEGLGVKELCVIAQDTTRYGQDLYGEFKLAELLNRITEETSIPWIRVLYCYPDKITDELIDVLANNPRVLKYIDLPIQHISDHMLKAMNRHGDSALIRSVVKKLRERVPGIVIRTTLIVGFPGETEEDFTELCEYVKEAKFDRLGAFPYSREEGTPAYDFDDQIDEQTKQDRYDIVMQTQGNITDELKEKRVGQTIEVLCEGYDPVSETFYGRSEADAAEIDGKVYFHAKKNSVAEGEFVKVKITEAVDYDLVGDKI